MKRIYLRFLWLLVCLVLPLQGQAISQSELLDTERFQHIDSTVDSGRGDGKYLDLESIRTIVDSNGHRRIEATLYVLMPASNLIQGIQIEYDYQLNQSLRHLINAHEKALKQGTHTPYISIWRAKDENSGITGMVKAAGAFTNDGSVRASLQQANIEAMILPATFGLERYTLPNLIYQKAYGLAYDDEP